MGCSLFSNSHFEMGVTVMGVAEHFGHTGLVSQNNFCHIKAVSENKKDVYSKYSRILYLFFNRYACFLSLKPHFEPILSIHCSSLIKVETKHQTNFLLTKLQKRVHKRL